MKANELMIGDMVRVSNDVCIEKGAIVRVHAIDGDNNIPEKGLKGCVTCVRINDPYLMSGGVWVEYLEPIPLAPEILEKNGWEECNIDLEANDKQYGITYGEFNFTWWRDVGLLGCFRDNHEKELQYEMIIELPIKYVHELQHALRLCGIEKEITM